MGLLSASGYLVLFSSLFTHGAFKDTDQYESVKDFHSDAALEVQPDGRQHFRGGNFTLRCSVKGINSTSWILRRLQGAKTRSGCLQLNGTESRDGPEECHFIDIDYKNSGLYWCESPAENKTSNTINITVSYDSKDENTFTGSLVWVSGLCIVLILLVLLPVLWLLFPGFREKLHVCPNRAFKRERVKQEMPKTKQDVTEIQWDLPWMEMDNLLDKHQTPGS
ncbi:uncharacterized protein LOC131542750 [Onychostoma macrolepis]|uniref:Ig-like domain-containing protein n=1 Tax=Onychostoma macrolepis TaxID=369639 RepID=A0A7J6CZ82_9TELE|nr:uncharacterized protein LOC131542750 [Onychostoma macrolepis]KAF4112260.1 hypothetical protein G5714_007055 [Onychostoma macrolepis]